LLLSFLLLLQAGPAASAAPPAIKPDTYLAFGDSITDGAGSSDETGFRGILEAALKARFGSAVVINGGTPGADSRRGQRSIAAAISKHQPSVTLVLFGTNDWAAEPREPSSTANSLRRIVRDAKSPGGAVYLATIPPVNLGFDENVTPARADWIRKANALIGDVAREESVVLVDVHAAFAASESPKSLFADAIHPNDAGYAVIAKAFFDAITAARREATSPRSR
jgi:acyl-CoA thioesterase-1